MHRIEYAAEALVAAAIVTGPLWAKYPLAVMAALWGM